MACVRGHKACLDNHSLSEAHPIDLIGSTPLPSQQKGLFTRYFGSSGLWLRRIWCLKAKARKRTLRSDQRNAAILISVFGAETPLVEITAARISEYRATRLALPISPYAVNRPLAMLRHLLRLAHEEWEVLPSVPRIRLEREPQGRLRWLTPEEATKLLEACRQHRGAPLVDLVEFCLYTGLRQAEALGLTWDRVDRSRGVILLEVTKSGRRREVPLCGPADAVLARRKGEGKVFGTSSWTMFRNGWEKAVALAGLHDLHFHDLRHTFASWAVQRGATLPELKDLLGHATLAMVMRYAHLSPEHLRTAVSRLDGVLTLPGRNRADELKSEEQAVQPSNLSAWLR
jgi:integrase